MAVFLCAILLVGHFGFSTASGKEFLISFLENRVVKKPAKPQCVTLTTLLDDNIAVQVTSLFPDLNFNTTVIINNGTSEYICLDNSLQLEGTRVSRKVVKIFADQNINVMVHDHEVHSTDSYIAIPVENYGTGYYIINNVGQNLLSVTAKENDTTVNIKFPIGEIISDNYEVNYDGVTLFNPSNLVLTLQEYELFHLHINHDLTGVYVSSNKPVAVVSGNKKTSTYSLGKDHLAEQMPPIDTWGTHFTSVPSPGKTSTDIYTILASAPCTSVTVGNTTYLLENEGDMIRLNLSSTNPLVVDSQKPVLVTKCVATNMNIEPCMMVFVPRKQWLNHYIFSFPKHDDRDGYLILIVESQFRTSILINEEPINIPQWIEVDNTDLSVGYILLPNALYTLYLPETDGYFAAYIQHSHKKFAYCTSIGMKLDKLNTDWTHSESDTPCTTIPSSPADTSTEETITDSTHQNDRSSTEPMVSESATVSIIDETDDSWTDDNNLTSPSYETCFTANPQLLNLSVTDEEFLNIIEELKEHLKVVPQKTSQAVRKKISVPDYRPSSTTIGVSWWIVMIVGFIFGSLAGDMLRMVKDLRFGVRGGR